METRQFGMELPEGRHPWQVADSLKWLRSSGYDFCELCMTGFPLIVEGTVNARYVDYLAPILAQADLGYTFHIGTGLDLRTAEDVSVHRKTLLASIDVCAQLRGAVLTVHFEQASPRKNLEDGFVETYREAAAYAKERNVLLCMENIEVEDYRRVLDLLDDIHHPNLRMTLDFGHLYLATRYFGGDYFAAIDQTAPYVAHVHLHDNTGTYEPLRLQDFTRYKLVGLNERIAFGRGDIHLPVFWGTLPVAESVRRLLSHGYAGRILLESGGDLYEPFYPQMLKEIKQVILDEM